MSVGSNAQVIRTCLRTAQDVRHCGEYVLGLSEYISLPVRGGFRVGVGRQ